MAAAGGRYWPPRADLRLLRALRAASPGAPRGNCGERAITLMTWPYGIKAIQSTLDIVVR